jgi:membrane-associated phospholipid phosphatase
MRSLLTSSRALVLVGCVILAIPDAWSCGWSVIDHRWDYDASGMWAPNVYRGILGFLTVAQVGGALWEGSETALGKTMWQGIDAQLIGVVASEGMKRVFTRERPAQTDDPCNWFSGGSNHSFPSGEATTAAALVTPYVLEYGRDHPSTYALLLLPLYVGVGRIQNQAHWQSDVLGGWVLGALAGWYAHNRETPLLIEILPDGVGIGLKTLF